LTGKKIPEIRANFFFSENDSIDGSNMKHQMVLNVVFLGVLSLWLSYNNPIASSG
jgi:hypothetical protein